MPTFIVISKLSVMGERLRRLDRVFPRNPIYFIEANMYHRRQILADVDVHAAVERFAEAGSERGAWLGGS